MGVERKPGFRAIFLISFLTVTALLTGYLSGKVKPLYTYYNFTYGARSLAMGNAFTALANDLTAVYRNPAGMAEIDGPRLFVNYREDKLRCRYQPENDPGGPYPREYTYEFSSALKNYDFFSIAVPVYLWDIKWNFACSYYRYIPYGFAGRSLGRLTTTRNGNIETEETRLVIEGSSGIDVLAFTGAFYLADYLSFGATLQRFFNSGEIAYDLTAPGSSSSRAYTENIKGLNVVLGLLLKLDENISLGLNYHTKVSGTLESRYYFEDITLPGNPTDVATEAGVIVPAQFSAGIAVKPSRSLLLSFDYSVIKWSRAALTNYYGWEQDLEFPVRDDFSFSQKNNVNYRLGMELNFPIGQSALFLRGGWCSDGQLFVDAPGNRVKVKGYSLGIGLDIPSLFQMDIGYMKQDATWNESSYFNNLDTVATDYGNKIFSISFTFGFPGKKRL